jgi:hypothetical protein
MTKERRDWRELCSAIAREPDQTKLLELMEELLAALEERESSSLAGSDGPLSLA